MWGGEGVRGGGGVTPSPARASRSAVSPPDRLSPAPTSTEPCPLKQQTIKQTNNQTNKQTNKQASKQTKSRWSIDQFYRCLINAVASVLTIEKIFDFLLTP